MEISTEVADALTKGDPMFRKGAEAMYRGCPAPIANVPYMYASDVAGKLAKGHAFAATYYDDSDGRCWSLRSTPEGADVAQIAEAFGGGGHKHAAGFRMTREEAIDFEIHGGVN